MNPTCFVAVPRVYEKVHARIMAKADAGSPIKQKIFAWAVAVGRERVPYVTEDEPLPSALAQEAKMADEPGLQEDPQRLGGQLPLRGLGRRAAVAGPRRVLRGRRASRSSKATA